MGPRYTCAAVVRFSGKIDFGNYWKLGNHYTYGEVSGIERS